MAMEAKDVKAWLNTIPDDHLVAVDDGGLTLIDCANREVYCEVGGEREDEEPVADPRRPGYCVQPGATDCDTCSLSHYGRDCQNNPIK